MPPDINFPLPDGPPAGGHSADQLSRWDLAHVWHPFTQMAHYAQADAPVIVAGRGVRLQDARGRWYYDASSSIWVNVHGHAHPHINAAIARQLDRIAHSTQLGQASEPAILLARELVRIAPGAGQLSRVFFSDNGAGAVEAAIKIAVQYFANLGRPEKQLILGFTDNYHGDTLGAVGVSPDPLFHWAYAGLLPPHPRVPFPYAYRCSEGAARARAEPASGCERACDRACGRHGDHGGGGGCLAAVEAVLREQADRLAAVIIEPVQGAGGVVPAPAGYLANLRRLCDAYGVLLIVDEVATAFGRTGRMFACEYDAVVPDLLCLAKGLTGGYLPVGATLAREEIYRAFLGPRRRAFYHGHSYTGNQLGCAAALASLELMPDLLASLGGRIELVRGLLRRFTDLPMIGDIRQAGLMVGLEIVADRTTARRFDDELRVGYIVAGHARRRGMLIRPIGPNMVFMPPPVSSADELNEMLNILYDSFVEAAPQLAQLARLPPEGAS